MALRIAYGDDPTKVDPTKLAIRCPHCRKQGVFSGRLSDLAFHKEPDGDNARVGIRECPNPECRGIVFFENERHGRQTYPPETIDFDSSDLPERIVTAFSEAVICHASGAYLAAALMVRRTLEELCEDRGARGKDLKTRLAQLGATIVVPADLLEAADELRLLGNDAAHIEARLYDDIGEAEVALAIDLAKELLKAAYQYGSLVNRLRSLRTP